jgi:hypothetical protein
MIDNDKPAKTERPYPYKRDMTGRCRPNRKVFAGLGADIKPHVPVIVTQLPKVGSEFHWNIHWVDKIPLGIARRLGPGHPKKQLASGH